MAVDFLWAAGSNGLITPLLTLLSTEMNSTINNGTKTSTVGGASGVFAQSDTAQAQWGELFLTLGTIGSALSGNAPNLGGWFLGSPDGTLFETPPANTPLPRPPDFIIPLPQTTITAGTIFKSTGLVLLPALNFKVIILNSSGQTFAASGNTLKLAAIASQY